MNTNKNKFYLFLLTFLIVSLFGNYNVLADERACNYYASQGSQACNSATYKGYKCEWDGSLKGGARCKKSNNLADDVKENITSCEQITSHETCVSSKIDGHECIWRQGACYSNTIIDDGTDETIIADDQDQRDQADNNSNNSDQKIEKEVKCSDGQSLVDGKCIVDGYVGENICEEDSIQRILKLVGYIIIIVKVIVPIILIVLGSFDLYKGVIGKDEKALTKGIKTLLLRLVLGVFIFFIPNIVDWAFDLFYENAGGDNNKQCITCVLDPENCQ